MWLAECHLLSNENLLHDCCAPFKAQLQVSYPIDKFLAFCLLSFSTGCQQQQPWHLNAREEGDMVQLCLSNESTCPQQDGISLDDISVYRYDSVHDNEIVWETSPEMSITNERIGGIVTCGIPPKNWRNRIRPSVLVCGKAYLVNPGPKLFARKM